MESLLWSVWCPSWYKQVLVLISPGKPYLTTYNKLIYGRKTHNTDIHTDTDRDRLSQAVLRVLHQTLKKKETPIVFNLTEILRWQLYGFGGVSFYCRLVLNSWTQKMIYPSCLLRSWPTDMCYHMCGSIDFKFPFLQKQLARHGGNTSEIITLIARSCLKGTTLSKPFEYWSHGKLSIVLLVPEVLATQEAEDRRIIWAQKVEDTRSNTEITPPPLFSFLSLGQGLSL